MEEYLIVKPSQIEGAGKGLYTTKEISRGTKIVEYKGKIITWAYALEHEDENPYLYYVSDDYVIDGKSKKMSLASYVNDARGLTRIKSLLNNCKYVQEENKVFVVATKYIPEGAEILVGYGKEYWDTIKKNRLL